MKRNYAIGAFVLLLTLVLLGTVGIAAELPKGQPPVFTVPTTGTIIDVTYVPEFDDWWVKCREGDGIAVYSYDRQTKKWGKVIFVPEKAKAAARKQEKTKTHKAPKPGQKAEQPAAVNQGTTPQSAPEKKKEAVESPKKGAHQKETKPSRRKWWDPLGILKTK
ncbi:MAG: hypothetical protein P8182_08865 [Deltaproteobacteria bacterium]